MDKQSKWYQAIQQLFDVAKEFGDVQVQNDDDFEKVYFAVKEKAKSQSDFVIDLLIAFTREKEREYKNGND